ncbi:hypothetical protein Acel_1790 [Acidothermus cellulolyticus 11B]|uniref:Uncharacterized protein n=1 Tax=Acidothermus cellulolyticus (strain ATCC 43068 / DSM 8971 / 11B) TaxID=351607 RepID=A0LVV2_ACIC1|nr:hypothetical protein Acel_1790 [Acidothermus cellulolyticus 11B]
MVVPQCGVRDPTAAVVTPVRPRWATTVVYPASRLRRAMAVDTRRLSHTRFGGLEFVTTFRLRVREAVPMSHLTGWVGGRCDRCPDRR